MVFGLFKNSDNANTPKSRVIKKANLDGFVPPSLLKEEKINSSDSKLVHKLCQEFIDYGVVDKDSKIEKDEISPDEVIAMMEKANSAALNEKDFHEQQLFDEQLYKDLDEYEQTFSGGRNEMLDEFDEEEELMYNKRNDFFSNKREFGENV